MKKLILLILSSMFLIFGCNQTESAESLSKKFITPSSVTFASSHKTREKPGYEWVSKSTIIYKDAKLKEFLRVTHIFDDPEAQSEIDNEAFYMNKEPKAMYQKVGMKANWTKSNKEEMDEYSIVNRVFKNLKENLKSVPNHDKGENKQVFSHESNALALSKLDEYFKTFKDDDYVKIEFVINKKDDKYYIEDCTVEVKRYNLPQIVNKYMLIDLNQVEAIDYSPDLVKLLVKDKVKNYNFKEK